MSDESKKYLYAFDLSLDCTGLTIFDMDTFKHVAILSFPMKSGLTHGERLRTLEIEILKLIKKYLPTEVAMEGAFISTNPKAGRYQQQVMFNSAQALFEVHGVIKCRFWQYPQFIYQPSTIKLVVAGHGQADKSKVAASIKKMYPSVRFNTNDESDSFAIGITHFVKKYDMKWKKPIVTKSDVNKVKKTTRKTTKKVTTKKSTTATKKTRNKKTTPAK